MHLRNGRLVRTDIWREGTYLDLWSVPHFLSGMSVALGLLYLGLGFHVATVVGFFMLVAWEFFEFFAGIEEGRMNSIMDVVVGMVSFVPTYLWAASLPHEEVLVAFVLVTGIDLILSFFGWRATHKAHVLEERLHEEIAERREQLVARRKQLRTKIESERAKWRARRKLWKQRKKGAPTTESSA